MDIAVRDDVCKHIYKGPTANVLFDAYRYLSNPQILKTFYIEYVNEIVSLFDGVNTDAFKMPTNVQLQQRELDNIKDVLQPKMAKRYKHFASAANGFTLKEIQYRAIYPEFTLRCLTSLSTEPITFNLRISSYKTIYPRNISIILRDSNQTNNTVEVKMEYRNKILKIDCVVWDDIIKFDLSDIADTLFLTPTQIKEVEKKKREEEELEKLKKQFLETLSDEVAKKAIEEYKASIKKKQIRKPATKVIEPAHEYDSGEEFD